MKWLCVSDKMYILIWFRAFFQQTAIHVKMVVCRHSWIRRNCLHLSHPVHICIIPGWQPLFLVEQINKHYQSYALPMNFDNTHSVVGLFFIRLNFFLFFIRDQSEIAFLNRYPSEHFLKLKSMVNASESVSISKKAHFVYFA